MSNRAKLGVMNTPELTREQFENALKTSLGIKLNMVEYDIELYYRNKVHPCWRANVYMAGYLHVPKNIYFDFRCRANLNPPEPEVVYSCICEECEEPCMNANREADELCPLCKEGHHFNKGVSDAPEAELVGAEDDPREDEARIAGVGTGDII
jgi:hypothetical protein